ncbi:unnamed protein product, partial [Rotaria magnacalcarata]
ETEYEGGRESYQENEDYKGATLLALLDDELNGWVHHVQYILPEGRAKWWHPGENADKEEEEGSSLLTPIDGVAEIQTTKAWGAKISSHLIRQLACASVRSNL